MQFLLITCRRLVREKYFSSLSILSLALGMASAILIGLYLYSELSFDHYHQNHNQIYRLNATLGDIRAAMSGYEVGPILVRENPQFVNSVRVHRAPEQRFQYGDNNNSWEFAMLAFLWKMPRRNTCVTSRSGIRQHRFGVTERR